METRTGIILNKKFGQNDFSFEVLDYIGGKKGSQKMVLITQTTKFTEEDTKIFGFKMDDAITKWRLYFPYNLSEFDAINMAGKKLIKNWENVKQINMQSLNKEQNQKMLNLKKKNVKN